MKHIKLFENFKQEDYYWEISSNEFSKLEQENTLMSSEESLIIWNHLDKISTRKPNIYWDFMGEQHYQKNKIDTPKEFTDKIDTIFIYYNFIEDHLKVKSSRERFHIPGRTGSYEKVLKIYPLYDEFFICEEVKSGEASKKWKIDTGADNQLESLLNFLDWKLL
jgi:hypothetical protein